MMDPNANLEEQLALAASIIAAFDDPDGNIDIPDEDVERLAELVQALDGWIRKGGFLPRDWHESREGGAA
jgi:hypothetical protein